MFVYYRVFNTSPSQSGRGGGRSLIHARLLQDCSIPHDLRARCVANGTVTVRRFSRYRRAVSGRCGLAVGPHYTRAPRDPAAQRRRAR